MGAFDGNGNFIRSYSWVLDATNNVNITASRFDTEDNGFGAALSICVTRDGQGKMTTDFLPATDNTLNLGTAVKRWLTINSIPFVQIPRYPQTTLEASALVTPTFYFYPPGDPRRYGADSSGVSDSTAAIQAAVNCNTAVFVPQGNFKFSSFVMPTTPGFTFYGTGTGSKLTQTGTGITWPVNLGIGYYQQTIASLNFVSTAGTGHTIDTTYTGGQSFDDLYFTDTPSGFDNLHLDGSSTTYTHDMRVRGIQIYKSSGNGGHAGIGLGAHLSDSSIDGFIMNASDGTFGASYCIWIADGAQSTSFSNSHPYGALTSIIASAATGVTIAQGFTFTNIISDFSYGSDNVSLTNYSCPIFTGCWFQAIQVGHSGLTLTNCRAASLVNCRWDGPAGALYIVKEVGTTDYTIIIGGDSPSIGNFNNPAVLFVGIHSVIKNFVAINPFGVQQIFNGSTVSAIPANTTTFLGANGAQAAINSTAFMVPLPGGMNVANAVVAFDAAPGAGQTYTISLIGNGVTLTAAAGSANPLVVTGTGTFGGTISIAPGGAQFLNQFNQVYLKFVSSATAGTPSVRYAITATG